MTTNTPHFLTTYDEYVWLREQCGYDWEEGIAKVVWERCSATAQENMLCQYRKGAAEVALERKKRELYGDAW